MFDLKIEGGLVFDGTGGPAVWTDIGITGGRIAAIGNDIGEAKRTIDAKGQIVTPGFIDVHTHYDGQASWDGDLRPSIDHGVTTAVMGNCGVGFAPVHEGDHDKLIKLMEGVEDIPGTALAEGLTWNWESFPDYLDALAAVPRTIDIAAMLPHDPLRVYVMGDRAIHSEPANDADIAEMQRLTREALEAGAIGFATGRSDVHKSADGDWTPSSEATRAELTGIARAFNGLDYGVVQAVSDFNLERGEQDFDEEWSIIADYAKASGRPFSFSLMQRDFAPDQWLKLIERTEKLKEEGVDARMQVAPRAIGVFLGFNCTFHPFMGYPSYKTIADLPLAERVKRMKDPAFKAKILSEKTEKLAGPGSSVPPLADMLMEHIEFVAEKFFQLGNPPDYEQGAESSLAAKARAKGVSLMEMVYDTLLERDGHELIYLPLYNYTELNYDNVLKMMQHPQALYGLSDGGAHVGTVCDASMPTYMLTHWTRDRKRGEKLSLPRVVRMLTGAQADYMGMSDRGYIRQGLKADINVIDLDNLQMEPPHMVKDLPAGGQRLLQGAIGYTATIVAGEVVIENGKLTGAKPGTVYRAGRQLAAAE
ncbi:N-acyl-D-amino-acid deacylase family protein [Maricaulis salignorans]|uniref:N-acyl-D-aspartate/D-glutamate deacylase n=1 Tax=Maricaulis salignorans TaxID=144026 RepID=A0A1G9TPW3_9PROT|nr:amidohydrolase family protein [Maricaulis salignorans]SDM49753.1 N-acyl-D-aspartate/D-glutamate deacylase [Maricaulis salignorans]